VHKNKLVWHSSKGYDGYKITYAGYDCLALKTLAARGVIDSVGTKVGVGKESDIYICSNVSETMMILKFHRLGRTSFHTIKNNRDYLRHRKNASWLYLSRLAALKEYAYMKALYDNGFPTPIPIDVNRHCILMSVVNGYPLSTIKNIAHPGRVYSDLMNLIVKLASYGLIHGDFNEFNIMISDDEKVTLIDFPQMVSTSHQNAEMYFNRDVDCIRVYFSRRYGFESSAYPKFKDCVKEHNLDRQVEASGFTKQQQAEFEEMTKQQDQFLQEGGEDSGDSDWDETSSDDESNQNDDIHDGIQQQIKEVSIGGEETENKENIAINHEVKTENSSEIQKEQENSLIEVDLHENANKHKTILLKSYEKIYNKIEESSLGNEVQDSNLNGETEEGDEENEGPKVDLNMVNKKVRRKLAKSNNKGNGYKPKNVTKNRSRQQNKEASTEY